MTQCITNARAGWRCRQSTFEDLEHCFAHANRDKKWTQERGIRHDLAAGLIYQHEADAALKELKEGTK